MIKKLLKSLECGHITNKDPLTPGSSQAPNSGAAKCCALDGK